MKEEQYEHLDEADIQKVDKMVGEVMIWMNSKMNQQSKQSLTVDPVVKAAEVAAKMRVSLYIWHKIKLAESPLSHLLTGKSGPGRCFLQDT